MRVLSSLENEELRVAHSQRSERMSIESTTELADLSTERQALMAGASHAGRAGAGHSWGEASASARRLTRCARAQCIASYLSALIAWASAACMRVF